MASTDLQGFKATSKGHTVDDGTVSLPSMAFDSSPATGIYKVAANSLGFSANGVNVAQYSSAGLWSIGPSSGAVAHNLNGALNFNTTETSLPAVGIYRSATNTLSFSTNTTFAGSITSTGGWQLGPINGSALNTAYGGDTAGNAGLHVVNNATAATSSVLGLRVNLLNGATGNQFIAFVNGNNGRISSIQQSGTADTMIATDSHILLFSGNNATTTHGSMSSAGLWTFGASGGTQTHVVNGNISITGTFASALTSAHLFVGNNSGVATDTAITGDITISNTGVTTLSNSIANSHTFTGLITVNGGDNAGDASFTATNSTTGTGTNVRCIFATLTGNAGSGTNGNYFVLCATGNNGPIGGLELATASTIAVTGTSDARLKKDITAVTNALSIVMSTNPVNFTWKSTGERDQGFIAQELQQVYPRAAFGDPEGDVTREPMRTDPSKLVPLLTAALKELKTEFDAYVAAHP